MSDLFRPVELSSAALGLPLAAAALAAVMGCARGLARFAHLPAIGAFGLAAAAAVTSLALVAGAAGEAVVGRSVPVTWFAAGGVDVRFNIAVDPLAAVMLATVTFVATWIAVFSAGYMRGDEGYARYFAVMGLFVFSMCLLVLADDYLVLLAGWEGVGVCSYLLVGYYYAKPSAAAAARKAFLVTRLGDVGFLLGIFLLWQASGFHTSLDAVFAGVRDGLQDGRVSPALVTTACLLLFCGAVGKSAQLPLYVWLPDAMEGPTPVSALIHAATMVTAGVYLLARSAPLFVLSPDAQVTVSLVGGATALLAAFLALAQTDLKRVLAYSTVSQLGYMFLALGTGGAVSPALAVTAAAFHLFTHAFFKALLFLGAGSVMHAMGNVIDVRKFGGLKAIMPVTRWTFLVGALALAGVPPLAGFWSKDQVLDVLYEAAGSDSDYRGAYRLLFGAAVLTAALTAFYTLRAYLLTFHGPLRVPAEAGDHAHESPAVMTVPLAVLAVGAAAAGLAVEPIGHAFSHQIGRTPAVRLAAEAAGHTVGHPHLNLGVAAVGTLAAAAGLFLAYRVYGSGREELPAAAGGAFRLSRDKLYVDEIYAAVFVAPAELAAALARQVDGLAAGAARFAGRLPAVAGEAVRPLQNGLVQFYALGTVLGAAVFLSVAVLRSAGR